VARDRRYGVFRRAGFKSEKSRSLGMTRRAAKEREKKETSKNILSWETLKNTKRKENFKLF
jgi:hypothetical protein